MKYGLALVCKGVIVARSNVELEAHSEAVAPLDTTIVGVGRKGDLVRVPHPLEDPSAHAADACDGVQLAVVGQATDDRGDVVTRIFSIVGPFDREMTADTAGNDRIDALQREVSRLQERVNALSGGRASGGGGGQGGQ